MKKTALPFLFALCASPFLSLSAAHAGQLFPPSNQSDCEADNVLSWSPNGEVHCLPSVQDGYGIEIAPECLTPDTNTKLDNKVARRDKHNRTWVAGLQLNIMPKALYYQNFAPGTEIPVTSYNGKNIMAFSDMIIVCNSKQVQ